MGTVDRCAAATRSKSASSAPPGWSGSSSSALLASHPWFKPTWLGGERALGGQGLRRRGIVAARHRRCPTTSGGMQVHACTPGKGPRLMFSALDASAADGDRAGIRRRRPPRHQQRPHCADGSRGAAAHSRSQRRSSRSAPPPAPRTRLDGRDRHQPELLDGRARDGAGAAAAVRPALGDGHDAAGGLGRGLSGRAVARHPRQRRSGHLRRRREDGERDPEDPRRLRRRCGLGASAWSSARRRRACR